MNGVGLGAKDCLHITSGLVSLAVVCAAGPGWLILPSVLLWLEDNNKRNHRDSNQAGNFYNWNYFLPRIRDV